MARPYLPVSPLQEMDQWLWRMEGSAFNPKVIKSVATCELRTVKKHILGSFLDYLARSIDLSGSHTLPNCNWGLVDWL